MTALALLAWLDLVAFHGRFWQAGPSLSSARPNQSPAVAVVVPARDEAEVIGRSITSLLAQDYDGPYRILLVDDGSTDRTGTISRAIPGASDRLTVIDGAALPEG